MLTVIGALVVILVILGLFRPQLLPWILSATAALPATAVLTLGGNSLVPFFFVAVILFGIMTLRIPLEHQRDGTIAGPGKSWMIIFVGWSILVTIAAPTIFAGLEVLNPRGRTDDELATPSLLSYSVSNVAQIAYILLGLAVVLYLARRRSLPPTLPTAAFWTGTALSFTQLVATKTGLPWPTEIFSNSPNVRYINYGGDGLTPRFRGVFAEPSSLALFSVVALAFFLSLMASKSGRAAWVNFAGAALAGTNLLVGASGTALVGGVMTAGIALIVAIARFIAGRSRWRPSTLIISMAVIAGAPFYIGVAKGWALEIIGGKVGSSSLQVRTASNEFSLGLLLDTYGIGVGIGSNRPNAFFTMLLSCVGIIGTVAFVAAMVALITACWRQPSWRPTAWALIAFFTVKSISGANMSEPIMWLLIGICAHAAWSQSTSVVGQSHTLLKDSTKVLLTKESPQRQ